MQSETLPPIRISKGLNESLEKMVQDGYYGSKSEAVREGLRLAQREYFGYMHRKLYGDKSVVEVIRDVRKEMWEESLKEAGGDEKKAMKIEARKAREAAQELGRG